MSHLPGAPLPAGPAPRVTDRLFFALYPDAAAAQRIGELTRQLRAEHGLKGQPVAPERLHVTLLFMGNHAGLPEALVAAAMRAAGRLRAGAFELVFDRVASLSGRPGKRPLVLLGQSGLQALCGFQSKLAASLSGAPLQPEGRPYLPHLTLLYDNERVPERAIEPIHWIAGEFRLMHSLIGKGQHRVLRSWPFAHRQGRTT